LKESNYGHDNTKKETSGVEGSQTSRVHGQEYSSKYQKLPAIKGKYNEPYHDNLYRFQDAGLIIPDVSDSNNPNKTNPRRRKMPKIESNSEYGPP